MAIIFDPLPDPFPLFDLRNVFTEGIQAAGINAALDFIAEANKPWSYYAGVASGAGALATGIPGAQATLFIVGNALDFYVFKSPEGSLIDMYLDGVAYTQFNTWAANDLWEAVQVNFGTDAQRRVEFRNAGLPAENTSGIAWMALGGPFTLSGIDPQVRERTPGMALVNIVSFSLTDSDGDSNTVPFYIDTGLTIAEYQAFVDDIAPKLDAVTGSVIDAVTLTINLSVPGGVKGSAVAGIENQRGGNFSFSAANSRYKHSTRIPGITDDHFAGKSVKVGDAGDVDALVTAILTGVTPAIPRDRQGNDLTGLATAVKTFRRK